MAALLLVGTIGFSQEQKERDHKRGQRVELISEQKSDLRLKRMTLELDLTASQQKEMKKIIADQQAKRNEAKAKMQQNRDSKTKPTADEIYAMQSNKLDFQIEQRARMKKLLNDDQFAKWDKGSRERKSHFRHDGPKHFEKGPRQHKKGAEPQE